MKDTTEEHQASLRLFFNGISCFTLILILISASSCRNGHEIKNKAPFTTYSDGYGFSFDLPKECRVFTKEDLETMIAINQNLTFIAVAELPSGKALFSVSVYNNHDMMTADSAFMRTVRYVATSPDNIPVNNYRLIDYGVYSSGGHNLRYKISSPDSATFSIMFYFMKNDNDSILYEIKSTCPSKAEISTVKGFLEKIALSVKFLAR